MPQITSKFEFLVRAGYLSRAVLYLVLGLIALGAIGQISEGTHGIFETVYEMPGGKLLSWVLAIGLIGYAIFRFASVAFDIEHNGSDWKGWGQRLGHGASGIGHLALAWTAFTFATGTASSAGTNGGSEAAAGILSVEMGGVLIGLIGVGFFLAAIAQGAKAVTTSFMQRISSDAPDQTIWVGRAGHATRAIVFAIIGWSVLKTAIGQAGASNVKTLGEAVASLAGTGWVFTLVAIGLLMFGLFSLVLARYYIVPELDPKRHIPIFRAA